VLTGRAGLAQAFPAMACSLVSLTALHAGDIESNCAAPRGPRLHWRPQRQLNVRVHQHWQ